MQKTIFVIFLALVVVWSGAVIKPVSGEEPMAVTLGDFTLTAVSYNNTIHVRADWDTQSEQDTAGFILKRGQGGNFTAISPIIPAVGDFSQGAEYTYTDTTAVSGQTYVYQLLEITTSSEEHVMRELTFTVSLTPTNTPIPLGGGNNGQPTATPQPTNTTAATNTPRPTATTVAATAVPTSTPQPTATDQPALPTATNQPFFVPSLPTLAPVEPDNGNDNGSSDSAIVIAPTLLAENFGAALAQAAGLANDSTEEAAVEETAVNPLPAADQPSAEQPVAIAQNNAPTGKAAPIIIGRTLVPPSAPQQTDPQPAEARLSTFYLWGGFIAAMILFAAAVLGSIILFTRKREP
ncbi:MAG: hypothetical protein KC423_13855 [Anaerolineales bacterium]|nr:hypothetical protein [Anaerolineales bacterium]